MYISIPDAFKYRKKFLINIYLPIWKVLNKYVPTCKYLLGVYIYLEYRVSTGYISTIRRTAVHTRGGKMRVRGRSGVMFGRVVAGDVYCRYMEDILIYVRSIYE